VDLRFPQQYVVVLNLLLIALVVYFLALAVRNGIKLHLARVEVSSLPESNHVRQPTQAALQPRASYNTIVQRDIFNLAPVAPTPAPIVDENLNITLIGTSHLSLSKPFIIVETQDGEQSLYREGDTIPNVGRVLSISRSRAVVLHNGHRVALQIPNPGEGGNPGEFSLPEPMPFGFTRPRRFHGPPRFRRHGPPVGPFGPPGANQGVQQLGSNRYMIARTTVDRDLGNMAALFTQIRAVPNLQQNGSSNGFRLSQIQPGSIFQQIGLEDGDIVTAAQGQHVTDPLRAMALLNQLRSSPSISLNLIRNGSPIELHYTVH